MAFCTKCSQEIDELAVKRPNYGYDFQEATSDSSTRSWEFSGLGDFVLLCFGVLSAVTAVITGIGVVLGIVACVCYPSRFADAFSTLMNLLIACCVTTSHWVMIQRVSLLKSK